MTNTGSAGLALARPAFDLALCSPDPDRAAHFYVEVFGALPGAAAGSSLGGAGLCVHLGAQTIELRRSGRSERLGPQGIYDALGYRVIAFFVGQIDRVCEAIEARGRRVRKGVDLPGQLQIRFAKDEDGNMLELIGLPGIEDNPPICPIQVGLTIADADSSRAFYGRALGLPEQAPSPISKGITRHAVSVGHATLKFWQPVEQPEAGSFMDDIGIQTVVLSVKDPEAPCAGQSPTRDDATGAWVIRDPDGNRLELRSLDR